MPTIGRLETLARSFKASEKHKEHVDMAVMSGTCRECLPAMRRHHIEGPPIIEREHSEMSWMLDEAALLAQEVGQVVDEDPRWHQWFRRYNDLVARLNGRPE